MYYDMYIHSGIVTSCKQTIYKQTGWRGAPELSNGAGWRQRAQAMAAKQCRLLAKF